MTETHLRKTGPSDVRVKLALRTALESEAEFVEAVDADEQLLALLGRSSSRVSSPVKALPGQDRQRSATAKKRRPGKRTEGRDSTGLESAPSQPGEERAAG